MPSIDIDISDYIDCFSDEEICEAYCSRFGLGQDEAEDRYQIRQLADAIAAGDTGYALLLLERAVANQSLRDYVSRRMVRRAA